MHAIALARVFGASKIIGVDVVDFKLRMAKELGADYTINASEEDAVREIADLTDGWGVDVSLECAGTEKTMESAIASVCGKSRYASGRAISVAAQFQPLKVVGLREGVLKKSGDHSRDELRRVVQLVKSKRVDLSRSITHRLPFEELNKGLDILDNKEEDVLRIVVLQ